MKPSTKKLNQFFKQNHLTEADFQELLDPQHAYVLRSRKTGEVLSFQVGREYQLIRNGKTYHFKCEGSNPCRLRIIQ